jgi:hypothetical protein
MAKMKKAQSGVMSTKLKDVPGKVKNAVTTGFNKAVDKVKNTTVGDAAKFIANPSVSATESALKSLNKGRPIVKKGTMKSKNGSMLKRADGSYSKRGLWDNIRANKGSGKKPTAAMLKQEKKIKAKTKK